MTSLSETKQQKQLNLISKLAAITASMDRIQKRGKNDFHGYAFATESDIADAVRTLCGDFNIYMQFSMVEGSLHYEYWRDGKQKDKVRTTFVGRVTIHDGDSSEKLESIWPAFSHDSDDKGANKAMTAFAKYATIRVFNISTGNDPDAHVDGSGDQNQQRNQQQRQQNQGRNQQQRTQVNKPADFDEARHVSLVRRTYQQLKIQRDSKDQSAHAFALSTVAQTLGIAETPKKWTGFTSEQLEQFLRSETSTSEYCDLCSMTGDHRPDCYAHPENIAELESAKA